MTRKSNWKSEFSLGIGPIDRQHQQIFERLLAIENSVEKRDPWHILGFLVRELADQLKFHFAVEEALLELAGYPGLASHDDGHRRLMKGVAELEASLRKQGGTGDLGVFFEDWFLRHVLHEDRAYVEFLRERLPQALNTP